MTFKIYNYFYKIYNYISIKLLNFISFQLIFLLDFNKFINIVLFLRFFNILIDIFNI